MKSQWDLFYGRRVGDSFIVTLRRGPWIATGEMSPDMDSAFATAETEFAKIAAISDKSNSDLSTLLD